MGRFGRVGVLAGGPSSEREISLRSGKAVHNALIQEGIEAFFIDVRGNIYDIIKSEKLDVAFLALHGKFGEDGTVQRILDSAGIRYTGSAAEASKLALDKIASKEAFVRSDIPTPKYIVAEAGTLANGKAGFNLPSWGKFPVVVKPQFEGSSIGLSVVKEARALEGALEEAFKYGPKALVEEYISGRELTVGILNDEPLPVIEIVPKARVYDYAAKYRDPDTQYLVPAPIKESEERSAKSLGVRSHSALGCRSFSRTDMIMDERGRIFVLEVNTIPGMTERSLLPKAAAAAGVNFNKLCVKLLEDALKA